MDTPRSLVAIGLLILGAAPGYAQGRRVSAAPTGGSVKPTGSAGSLQLGSAEAGRLPRVDTEAGHGSRLVPPGAEAAPVVLPASRSEDGPAAVQAEPGAEILAQADSGDPDGGTVAPIGAPAAAEGLSADAVQAVAHRYVGLLGSARSVAARLLNGSSRSAPEADPPLSPDAVRAALLAGSQANSRRPEQPGPGIGALFPGGVERMVRDAALNGRLRSPAALRAAQGELEFTAEWLGSRNWTTFEERLTGNAAHVRLWLSLQRFATAQARSSWRHETPLGFAKLHLVSTLAHHLNMVAGSDAAVERLQVLTDKALASGNIAVVAALDALVGTTRARTERTLELRGFSSRPRFFDTRQLRRLVGGAARVLHSLDLPAEELADVAVARARDFSARSDLDSLARDADEARSILFSARLRHRGTVDTSLPDKRRDRYQSEARKLVTDAFERRMLAR